MYKITRLESADILNISTRSIDRYIKSGKIRSKKIGKIVYVNTDDINSLGGKINIGPEIIIPGVKKEREDNIYINTDNMNGKTNNIDTNFQEEKESYDTGLVRKKDYDKISETFEKMFKDLRNDLHKKDEKIQELSVELGRKEEVLKNSVPIIDYKKSQFLLEESKSYLNKEVSEITNEKNRVVDKLQYEQNTRMILIAIVIVLLIIIAILWLSNT